MTNGKFSINNLFEQVKMDDAGLIACKVGCTYTYIYLLLSFYCIILNVDICIAHSSSQLTCKLYKLSKMPVRAYYLAFGLCGCKQTITQQKIWKLETFQIRRSECIENEVLSTFPNCKYSVFIFLMNFKMLYMICFTVNYARKKRINCTL